MTDAWSLNPLMLILGMLGCAGLLGLLWVAVLLWRLLRTARAQSEAALAQSDAARRETLDALAALAAPVA